MRSIRSARAARIVALGASMTRIVGVTPASAHQHRTVGDIETTVGWLEEPAYAGFRNAVQIRLDKRTKVVSESDDGHDHDHGDEEVSFKTRPVKNAELQVEVIFGEQDGTEKTEPMDLTPAFGVDGEYRAYIIPTRPGTYTFHIFGTVAGEEFDEFYTSGEAGENERSVGQYNDIRTPADVQFPAQDPSNADLDEQLVAVTTAADDAEGTASLALILAIIGSVVGLGGIAMGIAGRRKAGTTA